MKPATPFVMGTGPLADSMRAMIAADPDRYRPMSISCNPVGHCPCCGRDVYEVSSRLTGFEPGFATGTEDDAILHPRCNDDGAEDPAGTRAGGCLPIDRQAEWKEQPKKKRRAKRRSR